MTAIFVFGSNESGIHGAGAARCALMEHGAVFGQGIGRQGNSYGIPTKDWDIETLPLTDIGRYVQQFLSYARANPDLVFQVTRIGCGLAGYCDADIAPLFRGAPDNCQMPDGWREIAARPA